MPAARRVSVLHVAVGAVLLALVNVAVLAVPRLPTRQIAAQDNAGEWSRSPGRGLLRRSYHDETGAEHRYVVFAPQHVEGNDPLPIILFLCGFGEYGDDGVRHLVNTLGPQLWDQRARFPCVAVFPQCRAGSNWTAGSPDVQWAMDMLDATAAEFQTDPDRVYLTGASSGGAGAWAVAAAYPDRFAAVAPLCGGASSDVAAVLAQARLPVWNFVNSGDDKSLVASNRDLHQALVGAGAEACFTEVPGDGHDSWNFAYRYPGLYDWLLRQSRSRNSAERGRFELIFDGQSLAGWQADGEGSWRVGEDGTLVGEAPHPGPEWY